MISVYCELSLPLCQPLGVLVLPALTPAGSCQESVAARPLPHWKALGSSCLVWMPQSLPALPSSCLSLRHSAGDSCVCSCRGWAPASAVSFGGQGRAAACVTRALPTVLQGPQGARTRLTRSSSLGLCPPHTAPPARRHFEKSTETRPQLTRRAGLACERSSCVSARPEPSFPLRVLIGWCRLLPGRLPREGATLVPGLPLPSAPPRCPSMLGDHSGLPADRALLSQPPKTGLSCKMVLQAVGRVLR